MIWKINIRTFLKSKFINLVDDLILVFPNDIFIKKVKEDLIIYLSDDNFKFKLKDYFSQNLEDGIKLKDFNKIIGNGVILPTSKENIAKLKIRNYWINMNSNNKDKVWSYLIILLNLYKNM